MRHIAISLMIGWLIAGSFVFVDAGGGPVRRYPIDSAKVSSHTQVIGVDQFMTNVSKYQGPVLIEGIVSGVYPKHQMVALIDKNEFKACGVTCTTTCSRLTLPIRWTGPMPRVKETVRVTGQVQQVKQKLIFVASKLASVPLKK
jgi:hypothetical protein